MGGSSSGRSGAPASYAWRGASDGRSTEGGGSSESPAPDGTTTAGGGGGGISGRVADSGGGGGSSSGRSGAPASYAWRGASGTDAFFVEESISF